MGQTEMDRHQTQVYTGSDHLIKKKGSLLVQFIDLIQDKTYGSPLPAEI